MKRILSIMIVLLTALNVQAQKDIKLTINHLLGADPFMFDTETENDITHKFKVTRLEYYLSGISIVHDGGQETSVPDVYILADAGKKDTFYIGNFDVNTVESIIFYVGVHPSVNNGDPALWDPSHPLAPRVPSMHWGWASGYRFVAMEGKCGASFGQNFEIHALGNKNYFKQSIPVTGSDVNGAFVISLNADYTKAVSGMDMQGGFVEHGEDNKAADCLRLFHSSVFTNLNGDRNILSVNSIEVSNAFNIYPNPSTGTFSLELTDNRFNNAQVTVTNVLGETVFSADMNSLTQGFEILTKGMYFITIKSEGLISTEKLIVI